MKFFCITSVQSKMFRFPVGQNCGHFVFQFHLTSVLRFSIYKVTNQAHIKFTPSVISLEAGDRVVEVEGEGTNVDGEVEDDLGRGGRYRQTDRQTDRRTEDTVHYVFTPLRTCERGSA